MNGKSVSIILFIVMFLSSTSLYAKNHMKTSKEEEGTYDTLVVHGMVLKGKITAIGPEKLSFKLLYSEGQNHIAYKDIDSIQTQYSYHISYNRQDIIARVIDIEDEKYLKIKHNNTIERISISDIDNFIVSIEDDDSIENKIRNTFTYISGDVNLGFEIDSGTSAKNKANFLMNLRRKKAENETLVNIDYARETTDTEGTEKVLNKDELTAYLKNNYYYKGDDFIFTALAGDFDRPRNIQSRFVPSIGYGHNFIFGKDRWIRPEIGLAYVMTNYVDDIYPNTEFTAGALGLQGKYIFEDLRFINKLMIDGYLIYYPSLSNFEKDWIYRSALDFSIPFFDFLSMKLRFKWTNDSNPDPSVGNNKTETNLLFGVNF